MIKLTEKQFFESMFNFLVSKRRECAAFMAYDLGFADKEYLQVELAIKAVLEKASKEMSEVLGSDRDIWGDISNGP